MYWNLKEIHYLKYLFDISILEFRVLNELPEELLVTYLSRFKKKICLDDFDSFLSSNLSDEVKKKLLLAYDINLPNSIIQYSKETVRKSREGNAEFNRDLKIRLLLEDGLYIS